MYMRKSYSGKGTLYMYSHKNKHTCNELLLRFTTCSWNQWESKYMYCMTFCPHTYMYHTNCTYVLHVLYVHACMHAHTHTHTHTHRIPSGDRGTVVLLLYSWWCLMCFVYPAVAQSRKMHPAARSHEKITCESHDSIIKYKLHFASSCTTHSPSTSDCGNLTMTCRWIDNDRQLQRWTDNNKQRDK